MIYIEDYKNINIKAFLETEEGQINSGGCWSMKDSIEACSWGGLRSMEKGSLWAHFLQKMETLGEPKSEPSYHGLWL